MTRYLLAALSLSLLFAMPTAVGQDFTRRGADTCLKCHNKKGLYPVAPVFATAHASRADERSPFADRQCETCHGAGKLHSRARRKNREDQPSRTFGSNAATPVEEQNRVCLDCHESYGRDGWVGSAHDQAEVACASCHQIHRSQDRVFDSVAQQRACFACHPERRSDINKPSSHPLRFGSMGCGDCHDPHDGSNDHLLRNATINETCYECHAEKRGPYLWEHAPTGEDCSLCHDSHGSNHAMLLKRRAPLLCQQCHSPAGHPSTAYTSEHLQVGSAAQFLLGRACLNCHSQVHGSNHPSGASLTR